VDNSERGNSRFLSSPRGGQDSGVGKKKTYIFEKGKKEFLRKGEKAKPSSFGGITRGGSIELSHMKIDLVR